MLMRKRSPSLHPTSSEDQRCPSGHPASCAVDPELIDLPPIGLKCELCLQRGATYRCRVCGRAVCSTHYDPKLGVCTLCRSALCRICGTNLAVGHCNICGRLVCAKCSLDLDGVRRICYFCLMNPRSISLLSKAA